MHGCTSAGGTGIHALVLKYNPHGDFTGTIMCPSYAQHLAQ